MAHAQLGAALALARQLRSEIEALPGLHSCATSSSSLRHRMTWTRCTW